MPDHKVDHEWTQGREQVNFDACMNAVQAVHANVAAVDVRAAARAAVEPHVRAEMLELAAWSRAAHTQVNEAERRAHQIEIDPKAGGTDNGARGNRAVINNLHEELRAAQIVSDRAERRLGEAEGLAKSAANNEADKKSCAFGVVGYTTSHEARVALEDVLTKGRDFVVSHSGSDYLRNQQITASVPLSISAEGRATLYVQSGAASAADVNIAFREAGSKDFRQDANITLTCKTSEPGPPKWTASAGGALNATAALNSDGRSFVTPEAPRGMVTTIGESVVFRFEHATPATSDAHSRSTSLSVQGDNRGTAGARVPAGPATVKAGISTSVALHAEGKNVDVTRTEWAASNAGVVLPFQVQYVGPVKHQLEISRGAR